MSKTVLNCCAMTKQIRIFRFPFFINLIQCYFRNFLIRSMLDIFECGHKNPNVFAGYKLVVQCILWTMHLCMGIYDVYHISESVKAIKKEYHYIFSTAVLALIKNYKPIFDTLIPAYPHAEGISRAV